MILLHGFSYIHVETLSIQPPRWSSWTSEFDPVKKTGLSISIPSDAIASENDLFVWQPALVGESVRDLLRRTHRPPLVCLTGSARLTRAPLLFLRLLVLLLLVFILRSPRTEFVAIVKRGMRFIYIYRRSSFATPIFSGPLLLTKGRFNVSALTLCFRCSLPFDLFALMTENLAAYLFIFLKRSFRTNLAQYIYSIIV